LIPKLQAALGVVGLMVATAAISALVASKWNLFPPTDYEGCAARAAKDAKSKDALSVLLSVCDSDFKGRRKLGGGYTYCDTCQDRAVDIKGPNPTSAELREVKRQCLAHMINLAEEEERREEAERKTQQAAEEARSRQLQAERDKQLAAQQARATADSQWQLRKFWTMTDIRIKPTGFTRNFISDS
jgi:hypothetical protein